MWDFSTHENQPNLLNSPTHIGVQGEGRGGRGGRGGEGRGGEGREGRGGEGRCWEERTLTLVRGTA